MMDPGVPVFDTAQLAEVCGDDLELQCEVIGEFLSRLDPLLDDIAVAVAARDPAAIHRTAHALKGSSASVGARALAGACGRVESLGRARDLDAAPTALEQLRHEAERVREVLGGFLRDRAA